MEEDVKIGYEGLRLLILMYRETLRATLSSSINDQETVEIIASLINRCAKALSAIDKRMKDEADAIDVQKEVFDIVSKTDQLLSRFEEIEDYDDIEINNVEKRLEN